MFISRRDLSHLKTAAAAVCLCLRVLETDSRLDSERASESSTFPLTNGHAQGSLLRPQNLVSNKFEMMTQAKRSPRLHRRCQRLLHFVLPRRLKLERVATKRSGIWMKRTIPEPSSCCNTHPKKMTNMLQRGKSLSRLFSHQLLRKNKLLEKVFLSFESARSVPVGQMWLHSC